MGKILEGVKLIIFDVDGVIFDIVDAIRSTVEEGLQKYNLKTDVQEAMRQVAHLLEIVQSIPFPQIILNAYELLNIDMLNQYTLIKKLRIAASFYSNFRSKKEACGLFPGVEDLIKGLHKKGYTLAILSNNKKSYVLEALNKRQLSTYFDEIFGFNEVEKTKPDPEGLIKLMERFKVSPEQCIFLGDMVSDIMAGKAANIKTVSISSGLVAKEKLINENPALIVNDILELNKILL
jgi:HAD superfamily hydrolase (TIGR01662 family)